ncbi:MAG: histidine kinase [Clostridia bacterium]|nr:histidine kinase [Clostridia bacterium]
MFLLAVVLLLSGKANSTEAVAGVYAQVYFDGEYRIGNEPWRKIVEGQHIPATKGDVTLRGHFHLLSPYGEYIGPLQGSVPIALYTNHINLAIQKEEGLYKTDNENPLYGYSACGEAWTPHTFTDNGTEPIVMTVHNPHRFGNETAVDELLSNMAIWGDISFEKNVLSSGSRQRNMGLLFMVVSFVLLGTALFSTLLHVSGSQIIWLLGMAVLFAGLYFFYSATGVYFWQDSLITNTTVLGISMLFYMLFICGIIVYFLQETKRIGVFAAVALGAADAAVLLGPVITGIYFFDTWMFWVPAQTAANMVFLYCLIKESISADQKRRWLHWGMILLLVAFETDAAATAFGWWKSGFVSRYVFVVLFAAALIVVLRIIPQGINAARKTRELELQRSRLEAELKESRISIMLSQIRPHFIYNTLGAIERLCLKEPEKAFDLVRNFSLYLRRNFSELNSVAPILFSEEIKHVEYYVNIEKVRFPDMNIEYNLEATDFLLPALSVQPIVENAIKHGLMRLETGGTVVIRSYETPTHFCVEVKDNGAGFDTSALLDEKKHVGLRNIRERLKAMVDGELILESRIGVGTKAVIMVPKEEAE